MTVKADVIATLPAVAAQPIRGAWRVAHGECGWIDEEVRTSRINWSAIESGVSA